MQPYYERPGLTLYQGHVLEVLSQMDAESVDVCVTSPPYLGLRAYSGEQERVWPDGWRGGLGLEPSVGLYVQHIVEVCRAIRRVQQEVLL